MRLFILVPALVLAACAAQPARIASSPWPQIVIPLPKDQVRERFISAFASSGATIENASDSLIQLRVPDQDAALVKVLVGCSFCGDPYLRINSILAEVDGGTLVTVQYWRMVPKANGAEERFEITNNKVYNDIQQALYQVRDRASGSATSQRARCTGGVTYTADGPVCNN